MSDLPEVRLSLCAPCSGTAKSHALAKELYERTNAILYGDPAPFDVISPMVITFWQFIADQAMEVLGVPNVD